MKSIFVVLSLGSILCLPSCLSLATDARAGLGGKIGVGERVAAGALDVVTLPVQVPAFAAMKVSESLSD